MKRVPSLSAFLLMLFAISCSKSKPENVVTPVIPAQDTLSAGWTKITPRAGFSLANGGDIYFKNNDTGYLGSGSGPFLKSVNGGLTWDSIANFPATNISISQDDKVFAVSSDRNSIWRSADQGATFTEQVVTGVPYDVNVPGRDTGLYVTHEEVRLTTTGAAGWSQLAQLPVDVPFNSYLSIAMFTAQHAWVAYGNKIYHPTGTLYSPWIQDSIVPPIGNWSISSIFATSASSVYISSYSGYVYRSVDGGAHFNFLSKPLAVSHSSTISDLHFVNDNVGWMSVGSRIYKTTDAGISWTVVVALGSTDFGEIHFTDATHGWACCSDGSVLKFN